MTKKNNAVFMKTVFGMIITVLFPWIAGLLSALGELRNPFFIQTAFSNAVVCQLFSLPLLLAMLYLFYANFMRVSLAECDQEVTPLKEKSA